MRMIDVAIPRFGNAATPATAREVTDPAARHTAFTRTRSRAPTAADEDEELEIKRDSESGGSDSDSDDDDGGKGEEKEEFFDTADIADGKQNVHQKSFEFTFAVDRVQASIFRSNPDPAKPDRLLVNGVLEGFQLNFELRPYDLSVDVLLRSLYLEDKMTAAPNSEFRHLLTSEKLEGGHAQDLVRVRYQGVQKDSPEFQTVHEGFDKSVDVEMSTLNLVVTRSSILLLFDWIMTTFTEPDDAAAPTKLPSDGAPLPAPQASEDPSTDKLRVKVKLTSINLILNEDGARLATLSLSAADVSVLLRSPTIKVAARLGNLSLQDDFSSSTPQELLTILGNELADFRYETYDAADTTTYPGYDTVVSLRTGSLRFTFRSEPVQRMLAFFTKFGRMKAVYDAATQAAAQRATEMQDKIPKMQYDIRIKSPIVIFPRDELTASHDSEDLMVANLGEINLKNAIDVTDKEVQTTIQFSLRQIGLESTIYHDGKPLSLPVLDDVSVDVKVVQRQSVDTRIELDGPATVVSAKMSDVKMKMTQAQYGLLYRLSQLIPAAFRLDDDDGLDGMEGEANAMLKATPAPTPPAKDTLALSRRPAADDGKAQEPATESVDLLPELPRTTHGANGTDIALKPSLELDFAVKTIFLELYTEAATSMESLEDASLARFSLNNTTVKYKMLTSGSLEAEVATSSFTVHDMRPARLTKFREIIPATRHSGHQFMIHYSQASGADRSAIANITIDSPKIIFSLDPVFALLDYFTSAFAQMPAPPPEDAGLLEADEQESAPPASPASELAWRVNIVSPTIILLENPAKSDSEAVVLSLSQLQMSSQGTLALMAAELGMFLCRMDRPKENIRVLDDVDLILSMDSRVDGGRQVTNIELGVQPLILRVSLRDILLINSIVNRAIELSNRSNADAKEDDEEEPVVPDLATDPSGKTRARSKSDATLRRGSMTARRSADLDAQVVVTKETVSAFAAHSSSGVHADSGLHQLRATIDGLQLVVIGDMHDLPILDLKAGKFTAKATDWSSDVSPPHCRFQAVELTALHP